MRGLPPVRRIASCTLCATLVLGIAAPTALAVDGETTREPTVAAPAAPGVDVLLRRLDGLSSLGAVLTPVTGLLTSALPSEQRPMTPDQVKQLSDAVRQALDMIAVVSDGTTSATTSTFTSGSASSTSTSVVSGGGAVTSSVVTSSGGAAAGTPSADASSVDVATPATGTATGAVPGPAAGPAAVPPVDARRALTPSGDPSAATTGARHTAAAGRDDALAELRAALDALLAVVTGGDVAQVVSAATDVVSGLLDLVTATLLDDGHVAPTAAGPVGPPAFPAEPQAATEANPATTPTEGTTATGVVTPPAPPAPSALPAAPSLPAVPPARPTEGLPAR
ncbi:hypothetical protein [Streptomyces sp. NPDC088254]|uniref:hypothetical protein n=1 Tax=Streptomyces sp. NPDC088254 TaxID=3365847 RepID=UPI0038248060